LYTYISGIIITVLSLVLEPILGCLHRRNKYNKYAYLEWTTNGTLQLHRLAQEEIGRKSGTWSGCADVVPITKSGSMMASLDISNLEHPVLAWPADATRQDSFTEAGSQYGDLKDDRCTSGTGTSHSSITLQPSNENANDGHELDRQHVPRQLDDRPMTTANSQDDDHITLVLSATSTPCKT
jgi:hypothetical protein